MTSRRIRIGIDTGGTFTDVVALDEDTGELVTTKTPSTPINPADGFITGVRKVLDLMAATGEDITSVSHGTTVATNKLLEGKVERLGFITTEGYEFILEIARQAVPDGYGNSYFWVKPPRIVPADFVKTVGGRLDFEGNEIRPFDEQGAPKTVEGELTIKGISKPVTLEVTNFNCGDHPMGKVPACGANATASIKRSEFDMGYAIPAVPDEIKLEVEIEAMQKK